MLELLDISLLPQADCDDSQTLSQINLRITPGENCVGLVGDHASGVDELFLILAGEGPRHTGSLLWEGSELSRIRRTAPHRVSTLQNVAHSGNDALLSEFLLSQTAPTDASVPQNDTSIAKEFLEQAGLAGKAASLLGSLNPLERIRLSLASALLKKPALLLCDLSRLELAPEEQSQFLRTLKKVSTPALRTVFKVRTPPELDIPDSLIILHQGRLVFHAGAEHTLHYFNVGETSQLHEQLKRRTGEEWGRSWQKHRHTFYQMRAEDDRTQNALGVGQEAGASSLPAEDTARVEFLVSMYSKIRSEIGKLIVGQEEVIEQLLIAVLAGGHCLLEGVPGLAKTAVIRSLSQAMQLGFRRIQFTPDLMPADVTGTDILQEDPATGRRSLVFQKGPIFTQMLLADEINRTPAKTQAALLEAMQEHSVTAGGHTLKLEQPFFVLATQNPIEQEGTYPLPEAQKDRFLFHIRVKYPERDEERIVVERTTGEYQAEIQPVINGAQIIECQKTARRVPVPEHVMDFVLNLVRSTRPDSTDAPAFASELISWGAGPRACQCLVAGAKVRALLRGRVHVSIEDVEALALPVLRHRIVPSFKAESEGLNADGIILRLLESLPRTPKPKGL